MQLDALNPHGVQVLWPRIDQKTCLKSIVAVGLTPIVIPNRIEGDEVARR